ncbi:MAG: hypothetical protein C0490_19935, partial [Marivirga sp.]|nr:hypothetical protein [Marivirga sp.]
WLNLLLKLKVNFENADNMLVPFKSLPDHSRIWIYQSNRKFNSQELNIISEVLTAFTERWSVHGNPLPGSFDIRFDQFIILAADENSISASGCSIDDSVRTMKELGQMINTDLFDRTKIAFKSEDNIFTIAIADLKKEYKSGVWNKESLLFNNLISTKGDLENQWLTQPATTWVSRYIPGETVAVK